MGVSLFQHRTIVEESVIRYAELIVASLASSTELARLRAYGCGVAAPDGTLENLGLPGKAILRCTEFRGARPYLRLCRGLHSRLWAGTCRKPLVLPAGSGADLRRRLP